MAPGPQRGFGAIDLGNNVCSASQNDQQSLSKFCNVDPDRLVYFLEKFLLRLGTYDMW